MYTVLDLLPVENIGESGYWRDTANQGTFAQQANKLRDEIEKKLKVEGELKHEVKMNINVCAKLEAIRIKAPERFAGKRTANQDQ